MRNTARSIALVLGISLAGMNAATAGVEVTKLLPADGEPSAQFGLAVALDGEIAAVGAPWDADVNGTAGSVYIFGRTGGTWSEQDKFNPDDYRVEEAEPPTGRPSISSATRWRSTATRC